MHIAIVGGGPAGLYFAILMKRDFPGHRVVVHERNRANDTFGFGVVFSDETLDNIERADPATYRAITERFAYWDDIEVHFKGTVHRIGGNGFCGCERAALLSILQQRARELGVELRFEDEIDDLKRFAEADLIIAADGINSRIRDTFKEHFRPELDLRPNKFSWMGSTRPFDAFTFFFRETDAGIFIAHCYQYEAGRSTWVLETDPGTFVRSGLASMDEEQSARFMEQVFARELEGHRLITNRSIWRNFPMIRCERWVRARRPLLAHAAEAVRLRADDPLARHHVRQPGAPRA